MKPLSDATVTAIQQDEFATATIRAVRDLIYMEHRDWNRICPDGKIPFDTDMAATAWLALGTLINADPSDVPQEGQVNLVCGKMSIAAIHELDAAFRNHAEKKNLTNQNP